VLKPVGLVDYYIMTDEEFLTVREVARRGGHSEETVRKWPALPTWPEYDREEALRQANDDFRFGQRLERNTAPWTSRS
jgi:hypothetical protein